MCLYSPSSINWYRRKLGLNRHSTRHTGPGSATCSFGWCLVEGYRNADQCRSVGPCGFRFSVTFKQLVFSVQLFKRTSYLQRVQSEKVGERYRRRSVYGSLLGVWRSTLQTVRRTHLYLSGDDYRQDLPQAALPVLFLLTGQFLRFSPRRGDTLNRSNLTLIGSGVGFYGPQNWKKFEFYQYNCP